MTNEKESRPLFELGRVVATPGALRVFQDTNADICAYIRRHHFGDWGDLDLEDQEANTAALVHGTRILSAYKVPPSDEKIWIITEADRSATTVLTPEEY